MSSSSRAAILSYIAAQRAQLDGLEALVSALPDSPTGDDDIRAMTLAEGAEVSGISEHTLRSWARSGRLPTHRGARGAYLVRRCDLAAAITAKPSAPTPKRTAANDLDEWDAAADAALGIGGSR